MGALSKGAMLPPSRCGMTGCMADDDESDRPEWAKRLRRERIARNWSQADAVHAMRTFSPVPLPDGLLDQWKRWERGRNRPDEFYRPIIAAALGTVVESIFPSARPPLQHTTTDELLLTRSGMDTHELVQRIRGSSTDDGTLDALQLTVEQMCCDYVRQDPGALIGEAREWLARITGLLGDRLTLPQHREVLDSAAWLTLLVGCLQFDGGQYTPAEASRVDALQLGVEAGNATVVGWAHEMRAWFDLTHNRLREVVVAVQAGQAAAPGRSVSVQLFAQEAKAWARMGNHRNATQALEKGRVLLDSLPYPERPDHHFVVDPDKFDFYAMDCYRLMGQDNIAELHAHETIRKTTAADGTSRSPMRRAEAELTLGVVAARRGELDEALRYGHSALAISRRSEPSLLMVGSELARAIDELFPNDPGNRDFREALARAVPHSVS
jgi:transcriptional regulator with XRE-family HTH domain